MKYGNIEDYVISWIHIHNIILTEKHSIWHSLLAFFFFLPISHAHCIHHSKSNGIPHPHDSTNTVYVNNLVSFFRTLFHAYINIYTVIYVYTYDLNFINPLLSLSMLLKVLDWGANNFWEIGLGNSYFPLFFCIF